MATQAAKKTLSSQEYRKLLTDLNRILEQGRNEPARARLATYWGLGQRIAQQKLTRQTGYSASIIRDLAADLSMSSRNLYDAVGFFRAYRSVPTTPELTWSHYRALLRVADPKLRKYYATQAQERRWSRRDLERAIDHEFHKNEDSPITVLPRPDDPQFLYMAEVLAVIDADTLDLDVDLGFGVFRRLRIRLAQVDAPELSEPQGREARDFLQQHLMNSRTVVVKTTQADLHGRYVADLFTSPQRMSLAACFQTGTHVNDLLLQQGHARSH